MGRPKKVQEEGLTEVVEAKPEVKKSRRRDPFEGFRLEDCEPYDWNSDGLEQAEVVEKFKKLSDGSGQIHSRNIYPGKPKFYLEKQSVAGGERYNLIGIWNAGLSTKTRNCQTFKYLKNTQGLPEQIRKRAELAKHTIETLLSVNKLPVKVVTSAIN